MTTPAFLDGERVLPVVTIHDAATAGDLAAALSRGGFRTLEVTLRTPAGLDAIRRIRDVLPDLTVGAGSVMTADDAERAVAAGAGFIVSPGLDLGVVTVARSHGVAVVPGVATATELQTAAAAGIDIVKLFPAELIGGVRLVDAFSAVWPRMRFVPTGGIGADAAPAYLERPSVVAVGGSWMIPASAVESGDWDAVTAAARSAVRIGRGTA